MLSWIPFWIIYYNCYVGFNCSSIIIWISIVCKSFILFSTMVPQQFYRKMTDSWKYLYILEFIPLLYRSRVSACGRALVKIRFQWMLMLFSVVWFQLPNFSITELSEWFLAYRYIRAIWIPAIIDNLLKDAIACDSMSPIICLIYLSLLCKVFCFHLQTLAVLNDLHKPKNICTKCLHKPSIAVTCMASNLLILARNW